MSMLENGLSPRDGGVVLVDFSWLIRKSYHFYRNMEFRGRPVGHVYGVLNSVGRILPWAKDNGYRLVFATDTPTPRDLYVAHYKGGRGKGTNLSLLSTDFAIVRDTLLSCGVVSFAECGGFEADDVIYTLSFEEKNPLLWGVDMDLFQSPVFKDYFTHVERGKPLVHNIMADIKGKTKNYYYHNRQVNIPFTLMAALGKPSNNLPVAVRRSDKNTLAYLADSECPLKQEVIDRYSDCWRGGVFSEDSFYRNIMSLSFLSGNTKYKENLYCSFPRLLPEDKLRVLSAPENKVKSLQFLMTNQMHDILRMWGVYLSL